MPVLCDAFYLLFSSSSSSRQETSIAGAQRFMETAEPTALNSIAVPFFEGL